MSKKKTIVIAAATGVAGLVLGAAAAAGETPEPKTITETVEVEVPGETETVIEEVVVTETIEVTPAACMDALALSAGVFETTADLIGITFPDAIMAAAEWDIPGIERATADIESFTAALPDPDVYQGLVRDCEAGVR